MTDTTTTAAATNAVNAANADTEGDGDPTTDGECGPPLTPCDMIMKGGLSSGVVYPGTVRRLSRDHRFVNVGGASAGAIGAAVAAACEYHRQNGELDNRGGFRRLNTLPRDLGQNMLDMLQPSEDLVPLWTFLVGEMKRRTDKSIVGERPDGAATVLGRYMFRALRTNAAVTDTGILAIAVAAIAIGTLGGGWIAFAVLFAVLAAALLVAWVTFDFTRSAVSSIEDNNLGICDGHTRQTGNGSDPVTDWINELLSECAFGWPEGADRPSRRVLTFGDLWGGDGVAAYIRSVERARRNPVPAAAVGQRQIDLQVMGTNLSLRRPYRFPLQTREYFWCATCWEKYFPTEVIAALKQQTVLVDDALTTVERTPNNDHVCPFHPDQKLYHVPDEPDLPVIVAVRVSLSYPVLFCPVPFYAVDRNRKSEKQVITRMWFADGGISSNFPMHFFDSLVPSRPTFGITLEPTHPDFPDQEVYRPRDPMSGGSSLRVAPITSITSLLENVVRTMQNWADNTLMTLPGYRERVVHVRLDEGEGGLNFTMTPRQVGMLSTRGVRAADELIDFDMGSHRWGRYLSAMSLLQDAVLRIDQVADQVEVGDAPSVMNGADFPHPVWEPVDDEVALNQQSFDAVRTLASDLSRNGDLYQRLHPRPTPNLRVSPRL